MNTEILHILSELPQFYDPLLGDHVIRLDKIQWADVVDLTNTNEFESMKMINYNGLNFQLQLGIEIPNNDGAGVKIRFIGGSNVYYENKPTTTVFVLILPHNKIEPSFGELLVYRMGNMQYSIVILMIVVYARLFIYENIMKLYYLFMRMFDNLTFNFFVIMHLLS